MINLLRHARAMAKNVLRDNQGVIRDEVTYNGFEKTINM